MNILKMEAQKRAAGSKVARQVRRSGSVPCVLYGREQDPVLFQLGRLDMRGLVFTDEMHRIELTVGKESYDCVVKDVDFHPLTDEPIHADFVALQAGQKIKLNIPVQFTGKSAGQKAGGEVEFLLHELEVLCFPKDMPDHMTVDITALNIGDTLHVSDLDLADIEIQNPERQSLVTVVAPRAEEEEEVAEAVDGELAEGEDGEGGAEGEEGAEGDSSDSDS